MQRIGRYQVVGELGRGAMGVVYRALDPSIGRTVAIKTIRLADLTDPAERSRLRERLFREAQSAGMLSHPNIVTIYDVGEEDSIAYISMEFVDGPTLDRLAQIEALTGARVLDILTQAAGALDYAHKRGIVHRDIKPANIMIHEKTVVKITDFGIARIQSQQMTNAGAILGTPSYMSPEQIQGHTVDGRADQFSLGVIAYELMTGEKPFSGDSMTALLYKIVRDDPPSPQRLNPSLSWPVETVLKRAMAKDPGERYASCSDFIKALENSTHSAKGWAPLPPGGSHNLPTMMDARREAAAAVALAISPPVGAPSKASFGWKLLRVMRVLALVVLSAGVASFLMVLGYNYWVQWNEKPLVETTQVEPPPPAPVIVEKPKPSPSEIPVASEPVTPKPEAAPPVDPAPAKQERPVPIPEKTTAPADRSLEARLVTTPPGAAVMVDSRAELMCKTPCAMNLAIGRHTLSAQLPGYRNALRIFSLPEDAEVLVVLDPAKGTLMIKSNPAGGTILIDGQVRPEKTPAMIVIPAGTHRIEVQESGYSPYMEEVTLRDNGVTNIDVNWPARTQP